MKFISSDYSSLKKICQHFNPDNFLNKMIEVGELEEITNNYGEDVYKLCNNSVAWMIIQLKNSIYYGCVEVCSGYFRGQDHTWLKLNSHYIDLTLAQFIEYAPKLAITRVVDDNGYEPYSTLPVADFLKKLKNEI